MLFLADKADSLEEAEQLAIRARDDGRALQKFHDMVKAQGGDTAQVDNPDLLPQAKYIEPLKVQRGGTVASIATADIGWACVHLGGGRLVKSDIIDHAVGLILPIKVGDHVLDGAVVGTIHANDKGKLAQAREEIMAAIKISDTPVDRLPNFYGVVQ